MRVMTPNRVSIERQRVPNGLHNLLDNGPERIKPRQPTGGWYRVSHVLQQHERTKHGGFPRASPTGRVHNFFTTG